MVRLIYRCKTVQVPAPADGRYDPGEEIPGKMLQAVIHPINISRFKLYGFFQNEDLYFINII
jgi:hypothetical protein